MSEGIIGNITAVLYYMFFVISDIIISIINIYNAFKSTDENKIKIIKSMGGNKLKVFTYVVLRDNYLKIIESFKINVSIWLITVAIAAPSTPLCNTKINIGSNIVFNIAPATILNIEYFGLPSALIIELSAVPIIENGNPIAIILPYAIA